MFLYRCGDGAHQRSPRAPAAPEQIMPGKTLNTNKDAGLGVFARCRESLSLKRLASEHNIKPQEYTTVISVGLN